MIIINKDLNLDRQLADSDELDDHLMKSYHKFIDNLDGVNGGTKSAINIDLIMAEIKFVETQGRKIMMKVNIENSQKKSREITDKIKKIA